VSFLKRRRLLDNTSVPLGSFKKLQIRASCSKGINIGSNANDT